MKVHPDREERMAEHLRRVGEAVREVGFGRIELTVCAGRIKSMRKESVELFDPHEKRGEGAG